jgi:hypothetical protein
MAFVGKGKKTMNKDDDIFTISLDDINMNTIDTVTLTSPNYTYDTTYTVDYDQLSGANGWGTTSIQSGLDITGEDADITLNGKSMRDWMSKVEERLAILEPNPELEAEWTELKELGERYRALEQELQEKSRAWNLLKKRNNT